MGFSTANEWTPITAAGALPRNLITGSTTNGGVRALARNPRLIYNESLRMLLSVNPINSELVTTSDGTVTVLAPSVFRTSGDYLGGYVLRSWIRRGTLVVTIRDTSGTVVDVTTQTNTLDADVQVTDVVGSTLSADTLYTVEATFATNLVAGTVYQIQLREN